MSDAAIQINELTVCRSGRTILAVDDLHVCTGEVVVILGPNGAGKSTLLRCLIGLVKPTTGQVRVLGERVSHAGSALSRLRRRVGYVPQVLSSASQTPLTVREVVAVGRTGIAGLFRRLTKADWSIVDTWLDALGLARLAQQSYSSLSGGEQRKTLIAKAMTQQPEILVLDEPTANLDLFWREQIVETLDALHGKLGLTIVLVCHELEVIPPCSGRLIVLEGGKITADGQPADILSPQLIDGLYGSQLQLIALGGRYAAAPVGRGQA